MPPDTNARQEYLAALGEIARRIAASLDNVAPQALPIRMYIAGGAALHFYTGERVSRDVDAAFSRRIALPENLEVAYRDADGAARLLYFDRLVHQPGPRRHRGVGTAWPDRRRKLAPPRRGGIDRLRRRHRTGTEHDRHRLPHRGQQPDLNFPDESTKEKAPLRRGFFVARTGWLRALRIRAMIKLNMNSISNLAVFV